MPTQKTFCIDPNNGDSTGYDALYTSFAAYVTAQEADLVTADENHVLKVRVGDSGKLDLTGASWVTDSTRNIVIELENSAEQFTASSISSPSSELSGDNCAGIYGSDYLMKLSDLDVKVDGLLLFAEGVSNGGVLVANNSPAIIENCMLVQSLLDSPQGFKVGTGFSGYIRNCISVIEDDSASAGNAFSIGGASDECVINCTGVGLSSSYDDTLFVFGDGVEAVNCLAATAQSGDVCFNKVNSTDSVILKSCGATDTSIDDNFDDSDNEDCVESLAYDNLFGDYVGVLAENSSVRKQGQKPETSGSNVDAFGADRLKYDIGYYQTLLCNSYDIQVIFKDIGVIISSVDDYDDVIISLLNDHSENKAGQFDSGMHRLRVLSNLLDEDDRNRSSVEGWRNNQLRQVDNYISDYIKPLIMGIGNANSDILTDLDYWLGRASDNIAAVLQEYSVNYDVDSGTDIAIGSVSIGQEVKEQKIVLECISTNTDGSEVWSVTGSEHGRFSAQATTGEAYDSNGLQFTITVNGTSYPSEGDKVYIYVNSSSGKFQKFFRDNYDFVFDNAVEDGTETVLDSWAK